MIAVDFDVFLLVFLIKQLFHLRLLDMRSVVITNEGRTFILYS